MSRNAGGRQAVPQEALDPLSSAFNPKLVLYARENDLKIPDPGALQLDNIKKYLTILQSSKSAQDHLAQAQATAAERERYRVLEQEFINREREAARRKSTKPMNKDKPKWQWNVVERMARIDPSGPLHLLKRCLQERVRVRVVIRRFGGVRGHVHGLLMAFDQHFNMVLAEVIETYSVFVKVDKDHPMTPASESLFGQRRPRNMVGEMRERTWGQLFIRGDNVVLLNAKF